MSSGEWITEEKKEEMLRKLEPYIKSGLSIHKSCLETKLAPSTISEIMKEDKVFANKIASFQQYLSVLTTNVFHNLLVKLVKKMSGEKNNDGTWKVEPKDLSRDELELLKWHSLNSKVMRDEFGEKKEVEVIEPQERIKDINKMLEERDKKRQLNEK